MIQVVPFKEEHNKSDLPVAREYLGKALTFIENDNVLAFIGCYEIADAVVIGVVFYDGAKEKPFSIHKYAKKIINALHLHGYKKIIGRPDDELSRKWMKRLGFTGSDNRYDKFFKEKVMIHDGN